MRAYPPRAVLALLALSACLDNDDDAGDAGSPPRANYPIEVFVQISPPRVKPAIHDCAQIVYVEGFKAGATVKVYRDGVHEVGSRTPTFGFAEIPLDDGISLSVGDVITATQTIDNLEGPHSIEPVVVEPYSPWGLEQPVVSEQIYACGRVVPVSNLAESVRVTVDASSESISSPEYPGDWLNQGEAFAASTSKAMLTHDPLEKLHVVRATQVACADNPSKKLGPAISEAQTVLTGPKGKTPPPTMRDWVVGNDVVQLDGTYTGALVTVFDGPQEIAHGYASGATAQVPVDPIPVNADLGVNQKLCGQASDLSTANQLQEIDPPSIIEPVCDGARRVRVSHTVLNATVVVLRNGTVAGVTGGTGGAATVGIFETVNANETLTVAQYTETVDSGPSGGITVLSGQIAGPCRAFSTSRHAAARVFVRHEPIHPQANDSLTFVVEPELTVDLAIQSLAVTYSLPGVPEVTRSCASSPEDAWSCSDGCSMNADTDAMTCIVEQGAQAGLGHYHAEVIDATDTTTTSRVQYRFRIGPPQPASEGPFDTQIYPLRVPVALDGTPLTTQSYRVLLVRDPTTDEIGDYDAPTFDNDVQTAWYAQVLRDRAYRRRDDQLGLYGTDRVGTTLDYYAKKSARCGQHPWMGDGPGLFPAAVGSMDAIGVVHRRSAPVASVEGGSVDGFRDCAGHAIRDPHVRTFSAHGAEPITLQHELGHALFSLGDEYYESEATRRVEAADPSPSPLPAPMACCCCDSTGLDIGELQPCTGWCQQPSGKIGYTHPFGVFSQPDGCGGFTAPAECFDKPMPHDACAPLASGCVTARAFAHGGAAALEAHARPNVFGSEPACDAAKLAAAGNPIAADIPDNGLGTCTQLCGPDMDQKCPCAPQTQAWIVDKAPIGDGSNDIMSVLADSHGGTCLWCTETSFCVRWETGRGVGPVEAWSTCGQ